MGDPPAAKTAAVRPIEDASFHCLIGPGDNIATSVVVWCRVGQAPTVIASFTESGVIGSGWESEALWTSFSEERPFEGIRHLDAADGNLVIRWNLAAEMFSVPDHPWLDVTVTYRWDGTRFVPFADADLVVGSGPI